ncbi:MAG: hypothetical protein M0006_00490 [Magnetospirillum sp.]|nr:hypothetical protein [Magnetospirillum sp.]
MGFFSFRIAAVATALWCCIAATPVQAEDSQYHLGQGLDVGDFNIAGYANVVGNLPTGGERKSLVLDDLSLYVSGRLNQAINPFMETELAGYPLLQSGGTSLPGGQGRVVLERLYNDTLLSDSFTLRLGKMLTAVGEWNQIHAAPLVWTTTRPLSTYQSYSEYTSGASLLYSDPGSNLPDVQLYWQPDRDIAPRPSDLVARQYYSIVGGEVSWPIGLTDKIGVSAQRSRVVDSDATQYLAGFNARYSFDRFTLDSESTYTTISGHEVGAVRSTEFGGYVLGSYALTESWSLLSWYEYFQDRNATAPIQDVLVGISYRPQPPLVWKLEYLKNIGGGSLTSEGGAVDTRNGVYASFSVLF